MSEQEVLQFSAEYQYILEHSKVDVSEPVDYPPVALSAGEFESRGKSYPVPIVTYGNFVFIQAPPKTKKTYFVSLLASAYLGGKSEYTAHLKGHKTKDQALLHIDTEQGKWHASRVFKRVVAMSDNVPDDSYHTYFLREYGYKDIIRFIESYLYFNENIGMVIIDGIADLVPDVNDINASYDLVRNIMGLSSRYKCAIITVIHSNYGSQKPTGHLGSFLEKKAETQIILEENPSNRGWITAKCRRSRNTPFDNISFKINAEHYPEILPVSFDPLLD